MDIAWLGGSVLWLDRIRRKHWKHSLQSWLWLGALGGLAIQA